MIRRYRFGNPIETDAVREKGEERDQSELFLTVRGKVLSYRMSEGMIVYGLGENTRGINKRGWTYTSRATDNPHHNEGSHSLYASHNFLLLMDEEQGFFQGLFVDTPGVVTFDVGYTRHDLLTITSEQDFDLYVIGGDSALVVVRQFRHLIGRSYIPPRWAFGYGQSRWGYRTADDVREVVRNYRDNHLPLDSVYLDIDYMDHYKDFTVDEKKFPDFPAFVQEMKEKHIHLVPIIDAGVKKEEGYSVYDEGAEKGYFCKDENGDDFVVGVWPGKCCFPDVLNDEARQWFGRQYKVLLDQGIDGIWNDMNEPAIFYSEKQLGEVFEKLEEYSRQELSIHSFFDFVATAPALMNSWKDYQSFYHNYRGARVRHDQVHNLFGYYFTDPTASRGD